MSDNTNDNEAQPKSGGLSNKDFKKLMMTPRVVSGSQTPICNTPTNSFKNASGKKKDRKNHFKTPRPPRDEEQFFGATDKELLKLSLKYRDRAKERRETPLDAKDILQEKILKAGCYNAVAPSLSMNFSAAQAKEQMIQESKYLGGDIENTHLVKGLDYVLLKKVRSEMKEAEDLEDALMYKEADEVQKENTISFKSILAKNIYKTLFTPDPTNTRELFAPGRLAYVFDFDEETEGLIPTTVIRSKADIPDHVPTIFTDSDMIFENACKIIKEHHAGRRQRKDVAKDTRNVSRKVVKPSSKYADCIYDDIEEYAPSLEKRETSGRKLKKRYFDPTENKGESSNSLTEKSQLQPASYEKPLGLPIKKQKLDKLEEEPDYYAECYPGALETEDATYYSDDEPDFSQMDRGNKKDVVNRWDFETQEEFEEYKGKQEAMPKAVFQFGFKKADGRVTRKNETKNYKAKLDRDFHRVTQLISKRKNDGGNPDSSKKKKMEFQKPTKK